VGWEVRRGRRCYYRKVRGGRKFRSVCYGSGERGQLAAREDEQRRRGAVPATPAPAAQPAVGFGLPADELAYWAQRAEEKQRAEGPARIQRFDEDGRLVSAGSY
jgi:hypothetical protein